MLPLGHLGSRERRSVMAGASLLALTLVTHLAVMPLVEEARSAERHREREASLLARDRATARNAGRYVAQFDSLAQRLIGAVPTVLAGTSGPDLQAELALRVDDAARAAPATLTLLEPRPLRAAAAGLLAVSLRVEGESDFEGVMKLLAALESGPTTLHVGDLEIRAREGSGVGGEAGAQPPAVLLFRLSVTGFAMQRYDSERGRRGATDSGSSVLLPAARDR